MEVDGAVVWAIRWLRFCLNKWCCIAESKISGQLSGNVGLPPCGVFSQNLPQICSKNKQLARRVELAPGTQYRKMWLHMCN